MHLFYETRNYNLHVMPSKQNWKRDYSIERNNRTVKYAWRNRKFEDYTIVVIDLKKELGRFHPDYNEDERYVIDLEHNGRDFHNIYESNLNTAYNSAVDLQENYPDAREMHLQLGPENDNPESYKFSE